VEFWVAYVALSLRVVFGVPINHCSNLLPRCSTVSLKWESGKAGTWEISTGELGNVKQLSRLQHRILDGICSPELQSYVQCPNQPPFKFATKRPYSHFDVGKQESRHLRN
jgi:hypothetical protein